MMSNNGDDLDSFVDECESDFKPSNDVDAIIDLTESLAQSIEHLVEQMNDVFPSCEMGKISNFECDEMAIGDVAITQPNGITLTVNLCNDCMKILFNHVNN